MKKPTILYVLDTGTEPFAECKTKEDAYRMGCELLENCGDHGYLGIYFLYNDNIEYYCDAYEICFAIDGEELSQGEWGKHGIKKIGDLNFGNKKELKTILFDL